MKENQQYDNAKEIVTGYIYDGDRKHSAPVRFEGDPEKMAQFIMSDRSKDKIITDSLDQTLVTTIGEFLDYCDPEIRDQLMENLIPLQAGDEEIISFPQKELYGKIGDFTIEAHIGSDNNFEYTVYTNTMSVYDDGIIDNDNGLDSIPESLIDQIREIYEFEGETRQMAMKELQTEEAANRMKILRFDQDTIDDFLDGQVMASHEDDQMIHLPNNEQEAKISLLESELDFSIYHIIEGNYTFTDGQNMAMDSYLYVSDSIEEWSADRELLKEGIQYAYVENLDIPEYSEIGTIGVAPRDGALSRNDIGYDFSVMDERNLAEKIDEYMLRNDPLGYIESETYDGSHYDETLMSIKHDHFDELKEYFGKEENLEDNQMSGTAKEIMSDIRQYESDHAAADEFEKMNVTPTMRF
ncbi:MAG: hypothetical protein IJI66_04095 [Erysipelotrichaceae bacterium]|nr:hypothetical protein [Erysipelotrichaceae bacterium]